VVEHDGAVGGVAVWFLNYSVRHGRHGIYLADLYIRAELRGEGYGRVLLRELARVAAHRGYVWVEWEVLESNERAIQFYQHVGAKRVTGAVYRIAERAARSRRRLISCRRGDTRLGPTDAPRSRGVTGGVNCRRLGNRRRPDARARPRT
jgi:ribosomal protein S18 acetylase RimI-like enzyme